MTKIIEIKDIMKLLPHRYPFLLIDRVLDYNAGKDIVCLKNVTVNEEFFCGHFPGNPVMPGVLMVEACAQATVMLAFQTMKDQGEDVENGLFLFAGIDKARFKKPVIPGDQLEIYASIESYRQSVWKTSAKVTVDGKLVCQAGLMAAYAKNTE
jgi:3-hydroxyacyl-[acyl-carrier-protein] dehydratase